MCGDQVSPRIPKVPAVWGHPPLTEEDLAASRGAVLGGGLSHWNESILRLKGTAGQERGVPPLSCTVAVLCGLHLAWVRAFPRRGAEGPKASLAPSAATLGRKVQAAADPS